MLLNEWLGYTYYLHIRMQREPALYGIESSEDDPNLLNKKSTLIHSAAIILDKANMIRYDRRSGNLQATDIIGRIASHYYISHASMSVYNEHLRSTLEEEIDLFRVFSLSQRQLSVRQEERLELAKLVEKVPHSNQGECG